MSTSVCPSALGFPFASSVYLEAVVLSCFGELAPCVVAGDFLLLLSLSSHCCTISSQKKLSIEIEQREVHVNPAEIQVTHHLIFVVSYLAFCSH